MGRQKRLGILTSGGDCPGLNAVIRAIVNHATLAYHWQVVGIPYATQGLLERKTIPLGMHGLDLRGIDPLLSMGGTILGSINKGDTLARIDQVLAGYEALELDALIGIGGDGSIAILNHLAVEGNWRFVAVPKTIDNDVALTERVIGFDTAVNTVIDAMTRLTFTAASHDRVMVVEVMGREAGHLALNAGIAGGADVILIPEIPYAVTEVCQHLARLRDHWGRKFAIILVAEGAYRSNDSNDTESQTSRQKPSCGMGQYIANEIVNCSSYPIDVRVSVLGHVQRGGIPSALDRLTAAAFGKVAVDLVAQEQFQQMVAWQCNKVVAVALEDTIARNPLLVDPQSQLVQAARALGIYIGRSFSSAA